MNERLSHAYKEVENETYERTEGKSKERRVSGELEKKRAEKVFEHI